MYSHFTADGKALLILGQLLVIFKQLLLTGFDRKVCLPESDDLFTWIAVLHDEITGISGKHIVSNIFVRAFWHIYRFADLGKMFVDNKTAVLTRSLCSFNSF